MRVDRCASGWLAIVLFTLSAAACGSSGSPAAPDGGGGGGGNTQAGTVTDGCMYVNQDLSCESYTGSPSGVASAIKACKTVLSGTEISSCPTTGVLGKCINLGTDSATLTSVIYYYQADASTLTLSELCSTTGTYVPGS